MSWFDELRQELRTRWADRWVPLINGICLRSGEIQWVNVWFDRSTGRCRLQRDKDFLSSLEELEEDGQLKWVFIAELVSACSLDRQLVVSSGCGMMGGDGFVSVAQAGDEMFSWMAFFESSNPFTEVGLEGSEVVAVSSLGDRWYFPVDSPESFRIVHSATQD
jgi:hypothetical protein